MIRKTKGEVVINEEEGARKGVAASVEVGRQAMWTVGQSKVDRHFQF